MDKIKQLEYTYPEDYREVFEDIANLMFCTELGLEKGVNRRINQRAIESDPVLIDGKWYAYQAKFYDASTRLSAHKQDLITCVKGAACRNVTDLFLYINKDLPDTNPITGEEVGYIREIKSVASQHSVILHWRTLCMMEVSLDMPKYAQIKNFYFCHGNIKGYYDYVVERYKSPNTGNTLLGEESLAELYMQPSYYKSESEIGDVEQLLDEFISKGNHGVLWIVGEPGHGKTSMCIKAVADYRSRKRYQQARGVFWFRLNPQGTTGMVNLETLMLEKVFCWGRISGNRSNMIEPGEIEGSLVFLDGFDELKSSLEEHGISSNQFYEQVNQLAQEYQMHIVITSRTQALEQEDFCTEAQLRRGDVEIICNLSDGGVLKNIVMFLSPLTKEKQIAWINELISLRENKGIDTSDLRNYKPTFQALQENEDIAGLLKVPILLRIIVQNCFEPSSDNRVELYRELFDKTLLRQGLGYQRERLHYIYREIAFRIFVYDDDCTELNKEELKEINYNNAYLYQYYLHGQGKAGIYRITFYHRYFYQYFLSEFFYEKLKSITDVQGGENFLKYLWPRHVDYYVLDNLRLRAKNVDIDYMQVFKAIDKTDAFLSEYKNSSGSKEPIGNYDKAKNVFWNAIAIGSRCGQIEITEKMNQLTGHFFLTEGPLRTMENNVSTNSKDKPTIFISYNNNLNDYVDDLEIALQNSAKIIRYTHQDSSGVRTWESFRNFMKSIRDQDFAVLIISKNYLESEACIYEVMQLWKDEKLWDDKVMYIVTNDADIYNPFGRLNYVKYWQKVYHKYVEETSDVDISNAISVSEQAKLYQTYAANIGEFLEKVADSNNPKHENAAEKILERVIKTENS